MNQAQIEEAIRQQGRDPGSVDVVTSQPGPQERFLASDADIVIYGGAAGGGKTYALLLDPLHYANNPKFGAVIFRRTTKQVTNEGGLWDTAGDLYTKIGGKPNMQRLTFKFPSGAQVGFSHLEHEKSKFNWQGAQIPWIGFDELTHFSWSQFMYLMSRNRSTTGISGKIRGTCNPDPDSWVRQFIDWWIGDDGLPIPARSGVVRYFIVVNDTLVWGDTKEELWAKYPESLPKSATFIPASIQDNRILMETDPNYMASLQALPYVERMQLLGGNWDIRPAAGLIFKRSWFDIVEAPPTHAERVRAWDFAGSKEKDGAAATAGVKLSKCKVTGNLYIEHVERFFEEGPEVQRRVRAIAEQDGRHTAIRLSQDPGQAGKSQVRDYIKKLAGYNVHARQETGDKITRAGPISAQSEAGNVKLVRGPWNEEFLKEAEGFSPEAKFKDQIDALSNAYDELEGGKRGGVLF